ncbi:hypothetical protein BC827DRAFT_1198758 [Russula dissimulans]|nr:hypothetical protein BC827DRAFT_1198758 [Russula dissimulans]
MASLPPADQRRELRHEREEETVEGEAPSKRRRITPPPMSEPSAVPAKPVPEVASTPENAEAQKEAEAVVSSDKQVAPQPQPVQQQSTPPPEFAPHEPESEPAQGQSEGDPSAADADIAPTPRKIGTEHIQLVYETVGETLQCRMCMLRKRELDEDMQVATYPAQATYEELVGHCEQEHDAALDALASMTPADIMEMHQLMLASS